MNSSNTNRPMWKIECVRSLERAQVEELSAFDKVWMRHHWGPEQWASELPSVGTSRSALFLLRDDNGLIRGLNLYALNPWQNQAHLLKIALDDDLKGSGAAKELFQFAKHWLEAPPETESPIGEIYLEVATDNLRAISFYKKMGFVKLCEKKGFYSDGADALAMLLSL